MKQWLYLAVCLPLLLAACSDKVDALHFNEAEQVFEISKASELRYLNEVADILTGGNLKSDSGKEVQAKDARIKLISDIEISGDWTPIEAQIKEFDGNGHTIIFDDVECEMFKTGNVPSLNFGLFERLEDATVKNLNLSGNIMLNLDNMSSGYFLKVGVLVATFEGGVVENCVNKVNVHVGDKQGTGIVTLGGLIGYSGNSNEVGITLRGKVANEGNLTVEHCYSATVGGVIGNINLANPTINGDVLVENSGEISVSWDCNAKTLNSVGGVLGECSIIGCDVEHIHNTGNISLNTQNAAIEINVGGVSGSMNHKDFSSFIYGTDLYNSGMIEVKGDIIGKVSCIGGIIGDFGGCVFHQVINDGKIILPQKNSAVVGGLFGEENMLKANSYLYSCCKDHVGAFPIWNTVHEVSKFAECKKEHNR